MTRKRGEQLSVEALSLLQEAKVSGLIFSGINISTSMLIKLKVS